MIKQNIVKRLLDYYCYRLKKHLKLAIVILVKKVKKFKLGKIPSVFNNALVLVKFTL
jgi:hypothetical protein